jgi:hypothetical protein
MARATKVMRRKAISRALRAAVRLQPDFLNYRFMWELER